MAEIISKTHSTTSPSSNQSGTYVEVPLHDTIPIIFVPGIMGSNIFNTDWLCCINLPLKAYSAI
ncbi:MAG: hypothetical protein GAK29_01303 [Acinetobacter bereziniae]|uniref:Uncharacterized protein n=1 Tax=Acinetobacter bereziniae TaxID=106648 RepID=A0A833PHI8_ACIBZ|nr:MAG: hypothetical protein GAK29_01303 [Acinetobacter bereziniae]